MLAFFPIKKNPIYLKGLKLSPSIRATSNFSELKDADAWLVVTPAQHMRAVLSRSPCPRMPLILCSKGIEDSSGQMLHKVAHEVCGSSPVAVLSGPTFAHEVAAGLPTAVTVACEDAALGEAIRERIALPSFRAYLSDDVTGAEVGGAVKNVLAIACGVVEGAVAVPNVILNGTVNGDILAHERVELGATAKVTGNVYYNLIEMEMGAEINGKLIHEPRKGGAGKASSGKSEPSVEPVADGAAS